MFELERHALTSKRPRMPWRAVAGVSNSSAGASRSTVIEVTNGRQVTPNISGRSRAEKWISNAHVLLDPFAVKNVLAFRSNGFLCDIIAQPTDSRLPVLLPANYEFGMASHLTHAGNQTENIGVLY
jgi:hypothetical protein